MLSDVVAWGSFLLVDGGIAQALHHLLTHSAAPYLMAHLSA
jgi:hypothetical protein